MASDDNSKLILENFLPYRLATLSNRISNAIADLYQDRFNMTVPEWRVMAVLGQEDDLSAAQLAEQTTLDKVAVSRAVNKLLENNRIVRHFAKEDRRRSVIALSDEGRAIYEEIAPMAMRYEDKILSDLDDSEKEILDQMLNKLQAIQWKQEHPDD